jgi:hypothetical protein
VRARSIVAAHPCAECRIDGARFEPGTTLDGRSVQVPAGARLTLAFSFPGGLVDPASGADVAGPAVARVDATEIVLERGSARIRSGHDVVVVVPGARIVSSGGTFTVRVDEVGTARVAVEHGAVKVGTMTVTEGSSIDVESKSVASPPKTKAVTETATAPGPSRSGLPKHIDSESDTPGAEVVPAPTPAPVPPAGTDAARRADLERLAESDDARVARRATFTLAELDLAVGDTAKARARLTTLIGSSDPALAHDAAMLLARSHTSARERAVVWSRYLATSPSSPFFERALLARAEALLDAGESAEAKRILNELGQSSKLGPTEKQRLARLLLKAH